jgi:hypothetical protein
MPAATAAPSADVIDLEDLKRDPVAFGMLVRAMGFDDKAPHSPASTAAPPAPPRAQVASARPEAQAQPRPVRVPQPGDFRDAMRSYPQPRVVRDVASSDASAQSRASRPSNRPTHAAVVDLASAPDAGGRTADALEVTLELAARARRSPARPFAATDLGAGVSAVDGSPVPGQSPATEEASDASAPCETPSDGSPEDPRTGFEDADTSIADTPWSIIDAPEQMPSFAPDENAMIPPGAALAPPEPELTAEQGGLGASIVACLPREELVSVIKTIPGLADHADDLPQALAAMPADSIPLMMRILPPELVRGIAGLKTQKGG